jgi:hypothetical protein
MKTKEPFERHSVETRAAVQQIRRKMITRVKPSGKIYRREKSKLERD